MKYFLWSLLGAYFFLLAISGGFALGVAASSSGEVSAQLLKHDYDLFNGAWFDGKLPDDTVIRVADAPYPGDVMGLTDIERGRFVIYIVPKYNVAHPTADLTLLHEMAHIATWDTEFEDHGPLWQKEMLFLAEHHAMDHLW